MLSDKNKEEILKLKEEYFITLNGIAVDVLNGNDNVLLVEVNDEMNIETMDWKDFEKQTIMNNGKLIKTCAE